MSCLALILLNKFRASVLVFPQICTVTTFTHMHTKHTQHASTPGRDNNRINIYYNKALHGADSVMPEMCASVCVVRMLYVVCCAVLLCSACCCYSVALLCFVCVAACLPRHAVDDIIRRKACSHARSMRLSCRCGKLGFAYAVETYVCRTHSGK